MQIIRPFVCAFVALALLAGITDAQESNSPVNLASVATPVASYVSGDTSLAALNDGLTPRNSRDNRHGSYGNWNRTGTQWVEYDWSQPVSTKQMISMLQSLRHPSARTRLT